MNAINFKGDVIESQLKELKPYLFKDEQGSPSVVKADTKKVAKEEFVEDTLDDDEWC